MRGLFWESFRAHMRGLKDFFESFRAHMQGLKDFWNPSSPPHAGLKGFLEGCCGILQGPHAGPEAFFGILQGPHAGPEGFCGILPNGHAGNVRSTKNLTSAQRQNPQKGARNTRKCILASASEVGIGNRVRIFHSGRSSRGSISSFSSTVRLKPGLLQTQKITQKRAKNKRKSQKKFGFEDSLFFSLFLFVSEILV